MEALLKETRAARLKVAEDKWVIYHTFFRTCHHKIVNACQQVHTPKNVKIQLPYNHEVEAEAYLKEKLPELKYMLGNVPVDDHVTPCDVPGVIIDLDQFL